MPLKIIRDDITKVKADVIVNTANPEPIFSRGTDAGIYMAAGAEKLLEERKKIGKIKIGQAAVTPAFNLKAKYIIHTVAPVYTDGKHQEKENIESCYRMSLKLAWENHCKSIAFPLLSAGNDGYPKMEAFQTGVSVISRFLADHEMLVYLVVFDREACEIAEKLFPDMDSYIDERYVSKKRHEEYQKIKEDTCYYINRLRMPLSPKASERTLEDVVKQVGETFQEKLLRMIDERGIQDVDVYKRANISRKLFSKIRCNKDYRPKKKTALSLIVALQLNLDEAKDLLSRAGYAFSPSERSDLIIQYFIEREIYDIYTIDLALFEHGEAVLSE